MTKLTKRIASAIAGSSLLLSSLSIPVGATELFISGNMRDSDNFINVDTSREVTVKQNNDADVDNSVTVYSSSGDNEVKDVNGGTVDIDTGKVEVGVSILNELNHNSAVVDSCGGCPFDLTLAIADNARDTDNDIEVDVTAKTKVDQDNDADVENDVDVTAGSGGNSVKDSISGDVTIDTDSVVVNPILIKNRLNANHAWVGGSGDDEDGGLSAWIARNGRDSDNFINLDLSSKTTVEQDNDADVENDVAVGAGSGYNSVKDVIGGSVEIDTDKVEVGVLVDTMANLNVAMVDDCCISDFLAKIADNGRQTDNDIELDLTDELNVDQDNDLDCDGGKKSPFPWLESFWFGKDGGKCADVDITAGSGGNGAADIGGGGLGDPSTDTGPVGVAVEVATTANANHYGTGDFDLGDDTSVDIDIDFSGLMELLEDLLGALQ